MDELEKKQQARQDEWRFQWEKYKDEAAFLFLDWISPRVLEDFRGKRVLDAGCGRGHHISIVAPVAVSVTGIDLNASEVAQKELSEYKNVQVLDADIATYSAVGQFDVVYCIGVIHHTDNPDNTFDNLKRLCRKGGLLIIWCYSKEGNELVWKVVEPLRKVFLSKARRGTVEMISWILTVLLYPIVFTLYLLPLKNLPFYEYFQNFRRMRFHRNMLNVFDKLNAPQTEFISKERIDRWFNREYFSDVVIQPYKGVSYHGSGIVR